MSLRCYTAICSIPHVLRTEPGIVATAVSAVLDNCQRWVNFIRDVLGEARVRSLAIDL